MRTRVGGSVRDDHWQPAGLSAPAKHCGLRPSLFPTERPSLFWTAARTELWGGTARSALWGGPAVRVGECMCVWDVFGAIMLSRCFVFV